jgi:predicted DNA-binding protein
MRIYAIRMGHSRERRLQVIPDIMCLNIGITDIIRMSKKHKEKLTRTTITLPESLKERMSRTGTNWSEFVREAISHRLQEEGQPNMAEAIILNERVRRTAPKGWNSLSEIKRWRRRVS